MTVRVRTGGAGNPTKKRFEMAMDATTQSDSEKVRRSDGARSRATRFSRLLFWSSVLVLAFGAGMYLVGSDTFPRSRIHRGVKAVRDMWAAHTLKMPALGGWHAVEAPPDSVGLRRVELAGEEGLTDPVLADGGWWRFGERCPEADGCLAVEFSDRGEVGRAWPFRPIEIEEAGVAHGSRYEKTPGVASHEVLAVSSVVPYSNGDLLATFAYRKFHFPYAAGIARIDRTGQPLWHRRDYSHHEPYVADDGTIWVAGLKPSPRALGTIAECKNGTAVLDVVNVLDGRGTLVEEVLVADVLYDSPWASALTWANPCDPLHLNSVSAVDEDVSGLDGVTPGDMVLSLQNLNAFAILDSKTHELKRLVRGAFARQHSVKHLGGSEFVMFDKEGGRGRQRDAKGMRYKYSRVLVVDAATGEETVIFPRNPERLADWYSAGGGRISISPDGTRLIASYSAAGKAVEVQIEDGRVLAEFDFVHDMRRFGRLAGNDAVRFESGAVFYALATPGDKQ